MPTAPCTALAQSSPRPVDELEAEITTLAAHLNAATYRFLVLIADFDRREGWGGIGIRSCAHWLNWKCGLGLTAAREKLRVAHALAALPLISEAMQRGALSYAKVRAVTRIATKENERALLSIAENGTASHVETTVRAYRRTHRLQELALDRERHARRSLRYYWDDDGCLVIEGRLPPEQGAVVVKALEAADRALLEARGAERNTSAETPAGAAPAAQAEQPAADAEDASAEAHPPANASAEASPARGADWTTRQADAVTLMAETLLAHGPASLCSADKHLVHVHIDLSALCSIDGDRRSAIQGGPTLPPETVRRLCCDGGLVTWLEDEAGRTLDVGRKTRAIPPALRRALEKRDGGCRFPGCENRVFVDAHHIEHWVDGGETKIENLLTLCRYHHRLVHEGGVRVERDGKELRFARAGGKAIPHVPRLPDVATGAAPLVQQNEQRGLAIDASTAIPGWRGEHPDYNYMLAVLDSRDSKVSRLALKGKRRSLHGPKENQPEPRDNERTRD